MEEKELVADVQRADKACELVLGFEGGLSYNKTDKGGTTNYGISLKFLQGCGVEEGDLNGDGVVNEADILLLTPEKAKELFIKYFYVPVKADFIKSEAIAIQLFDIAVNSGAPRAGMLVQQSLNAMNMNVAVDGAIGKDTLSKINSADEKELNNDLVNARLNFYDNIVRKEPSQSIFLEGWKNRARKFIIN